MAVAKMKRLTLLGLKKDKEKLLKLMQGMGCVELTPLPEELSDSTPLVQSEEVEQLLPRVRRTIDRLSRYDTEKKPSFGQYRVVLADEAKEIRDNKDNFINILDSLDEIDRGIAEIRSLKQRITASIKQYEPWKPLVYSQSELRRSKTVIMLAGTIFPRNLERLEEGFLGLSASYEVISESPSERFILVAIHKDDKGPALELLEKLSFTRETFSGLNDMSPKEYLISLREQEKKLDINEKELNSKITSFGDELPRLKSFHDLLMLKKAQLEASELSHETESTFYMQGWVLESSAEKLKQRILSIAPYTAIELRDPLPDEEPSVKLENSNFITAFEPVVEGFSLPMYRALDPTAVMTPFYMTLFGVMLSDAGYGFLMALVIFAFIKIKKIPVRNAKMLYLLMFCGAATVFWGLAFNTVIGFNVLPQFTRFFPFDAINDPLPVMVACLGIGVIHLFAGVFVGAYQNIKRGDVVAAISDNISWLILLVGLGLLIVPSTAKIGKYLALIGCGIIIVMTGRDKKNPIKRLISGLGALYGVTSWVSDILSYMRLFGMGLATGVIGMVFNLLIGMLWSGGIVAKIIAAVAFVVCHLFNLGINALGAYVHGCRLQYIEFFSKFYEDGGKAFKPLDMKTRYVSIQSEIVA
ncbi:MAG TPA: V-type ATP synthase subunit I [Christensenellaceae bacterium]|jgi:V/A-type H+-transporting ATPase subunit I|nr:V-type ATP synthase subunit I [Christensenellaceae bacterium]